MNNRRKRYLITRLRMKALAELGMLTEKRCPNCANRSFYFDDFDAEACLSCDEWTEEKCADPSCVYCAARPDKPSQIMAEPKTDRLMKQNLRDKYAHRERGRLRKEAKKVMYAENEYGKTDKTV